MNLLALRYFHTAGTLRTISGAARHLRISQPALSKMIRGLEEELGHRLFERTREGVRLTTEGQIVFRSAEAIFKEERSLHQQLLDPQHPLEGRLTLGMSDSLAIYHFPTLVTEFRARHPNLRMEIFTATSPEIRREILADRCDLGFFFTPLRANEAGHFDSGILRREEFWLVLSRARAKMLGPVPSLARLRKAGIPRVESRHRDYNSAGFVAHYHATKLGFIDPPALEVNNHEVKKALLLTGAGFGILTANTVRREVKGGQLVRLKTPVPMISEVYWARRRDDVHRAASVFLEAALSPEPLRTRA